MKRFEYYPPVKSVPTSKKERQSQMQANSEDMDSQLLRARHRNSKCPNPPPYISNISKAHRMVVNQNRKLNPAQTESGAIQSNDYKAFLHPCDRPCSESVLVDEWDLTYWLTCSPRDPSVG